MPRINPVDRERLDTDTPALLRAASGDDDGRWNVFEGVANHPPTLRAMQALRDAVDAGLSTLEQEVLEIEKKGNLDDAEMMRFRAAGLGDAKMIVILAEIALYTLLNYFNRLARSEIEAPVAPYIAADAAWITPPDR